MTRKDRMEKLMRQKNLTASQLLMKIHDMLEPESRKERYDFCKKNKGNFSKMISGDRSFPFEYVAPIERILNTTMDYIENGEETGVKPPFRDKGFEYAAYLNDYRQYVKLGAETDDSGDRIIENYDEYNKSILDYIIEYQSEQGIKYLHDELGFGYDKIMCRFKYGSRVDIFDFEKRLMIAELLASKRENNLLYKVLNPFQCVEYNYSKKEDFLSSNELMELILKDGELLKEFLKAEILNLSEKNGNIYSDFSFEQCLFINPMLENMLEYALGKVQRYEKEVNAILDFGIEHNKKMIVFAENNLLSFIKELKIDKEGYLIRGWTRIGSVLSYEQVVSPETPDDIKEKINSLSAQKNAILNLDEPVFPTESTVTSDGKYIWKKSSGNANEYEVYKLCERLGINTVPKHYESKEGLDRLDFMPGSSVFFVQPKYDKAACIVRWLKEFQEKTDTELNGKAYVHGALNEEAILFENDEITGVIKWENCRVGEKYEDLIYVLIHWLYLGSSRRNNKEAYNDIMKLLEEYEASEELRSALPKLISNEVEKIIIALDKESDNYESCYQYYRNVQIFLELYGDKIAKGDTI